MKLVIDCSTSLLYLGLYDSNNKFLRSNNSINPRNHSSIIIDSIHNLVHDDLKNIKEIYCGIGPGSYTGLRVAVVSAAMLAAQLEISLYQISSLMLLASSFFSNINDFANFYIDARNNNIYHTLLQKKDSKLLALINDEHINIDNKVINNYPSIDINNLDVNIVVDLGCIYKNAILVSDYNLIPNYLRDPKAILDLNNNLLNKKLTKYKVQRLTNKYINSLLLLDEFEFSNQYTFTKEQLENSFDDRNPLNIFILVKLDTEEFIGYISYNELQSNAFEIINFAISLPYRKQQLGRKLFEQSIKPLLNNKNLEFLNLTLECRENSVENFYFALGFEQVSVRKSYYKNNENALLLKKEVKI